MTPPVPILMYHAVTDDPAPGARAHAVTPRTFTRQLAQLHDAGFTTVTAATAARLLRGHGDPPDRPIAITFDDGYADFHTTALPALEQFGFTATLFVTTGWLADARADRAEPPDRMLAWAQVTDAAARGIEIGGHSHTHPQLDQLPPATLQTEVTRCKDQLEQRLGQPVTSFAYPYGYSSARVRRAMAAAGYDTALAVNNALARTGHDPLALPRLTVSNHSGSARYGDVVHGRRIPLVYARERVLTKGYAVARRVRSTAATLARHATTRG